MAILDNNNLLAYNTTLENSQQAEKLFYLIEKSLEEAKLTLNEIDLISATNGPGSFTGVRIGLAAALGLKMASKANFIAVSNLQVAAFHARNLSSDKKIAVVQDARKEEVYYQVFDQDLKNLTEPEIVLRSSLKQDLDAEVTECKVDAKLLAEASEFVWSKGLYKDLEPLYIRQPYVG